VQKKVFFNKLIYDLIYNPIGWESKQDRSGKLFFIDHTSRSTTFIDPRLPLDLPVVNPHKLVLAPSRRRLRNSNSNQNQTLNNTNNTTNNELTEESASSPIPPPRPPSTSATTPTVPLVPTAYNDKVVAFLRQPNIIDILQERRPAIKSNTGLRDKVHTIRADGTQALDRFSDDLELTILLSLFEQEIMSYIPAVDQLRLLSAAQQSPQASPNVQRSQVWINF
jgi:hypothetical protein